MTRSEDDNGLRRVKIMEEAYAAATTVAQRLRKTMRGYRPDPALVISAFVRYAAQLEDAEAIALEYHQWVFSRVEPDQERDINALPDGERCKAFSAAG